MNCPSCLKEVKSGFCRNCLNKLFDGQKLSHFLPFDSPGAMKDKSFLDNTTKISISGVQLKYSLILKNGSLRLSDTNGQYILKPIPVGGFKDLDQAPANEHITMQIADQVYNLNVPPNALMKFKDGHPAYLVKRFDRLLNKKIQQEDFSQIAGVTSETNGENYKYDFSYEEIALLIQKYIPTYRLELEKFLRRLLFNYIFSNGDAHLRNFSAMRSQQGDYLLTPVYDLLCTRIHSPIEADMALSLLTDGFSESFEKFGFYTYGDFLDFGLKIGIKESRIKKIIDDFTVSRPEVHGLIQQSFLTDRCKKLYAEYYEDRLTRMSMIA